MNRNAYIFIDRNFAEGNGRAAPPIGIVGSWWFGKLVLPRLKEKLEQAKGVESVEAMVYACGKWAYGCRMPDRDSPDPVVRQLHRAATLTMYIVFGCEPLFAGICRPVFKSFVDQCFDLAKTITTCGVHQELKVEMPLKICRERK